MTIKSIAGRIFYPVDESVKEHLVKAVIRPTEPGIVGYGLFKDCTALSRVILKNIIE